MLIVSAYYGVEAMIDAITKQIEQVKHCQPEYADELRECKADVKPIKGYTAPMLTCARTIARKVHHTPRYSH